MTGGGDDTTSPYQGIYDWDSGSSASGAQTVTVHNNAGLTSSTTFTVTPDSAPPTGPERGRSPPATSRASRCRSRSRTARTLSPESIPPRQCSSARPDALKRQLCRLVGQLDAVSLTGGADTTVQSNRCYHYRYSISDNVGNQSGVSATSLDAKVDATTPVTSDDAPAGWQNAAVTVTLSITETGSGVASTSYRVDGGSFQSGTSISIPAPANHSNDGVHTIEYRTTDDAGNVETLRSATVRIDTTLPTTTDDAPTGWQHLAGHRDAHPGRCALGHRLDAIPHRRRLVPGRHRRSPFRLRPTTRTTACTQIEYRSTDNAGNVEPLQTATVRIDTQLPNGALTAPADGAHVNGSVAISALAGDAAFGSRLGRVPRPAQWLWLRSSDLDRHDSPLRRQLELDRRAPRATPSSRSSSSTTPASR